MKKLLLPLLFAATLATSCNTTGQATDPTEPSMQVVALRHTSAKDMSDTLLKFLADAKAAGMDHPTVRASADDRSLLVQGESTQVQQILMMVAQLDAERPK